MAAETTNISHPVLNPSTRIGKEQVTVTTPNQLALRRFRRNKLAMVGCALVGFWVFIFITADVLAPFGPNEQTSELNKPPFSVVTEEGPFMGRTHILGTDNLGRDMLTRIMHGARVSLSVGFIAQSVVILIGVPLGLMAGYFGGIADQFIMRFGEVMNSFPDLLLLITLANVFEQRSVWAVFLVLGVTGWVTMSRVVRAQVLQIKQMDYVTGARSIGRVRVGLCGDISYQILLVRSLSLSRLVSPVQSLPKQR